MEHWLVSNLSRPFFRKHGAMYFFCLACVISFPHWSQLPHGARLGSLLLCMRREQPRTRYLVCWRFLQQGFMLMFSPNLVLRANRGRGFEAQNKIVVVHIAVVGLQILGRLAHAQKKLLSDPTMFLFLVPSSNAAGTSGSGRVPQQLRIHYLAQKSFFCRFGLGFVSPSSHVFLYVFFRWTVLPQPPCRPSAYWSTATLRKALVQELEGEVEELTNALETRRYGGMGLGYVCVCVWHPVKSMTTQRRDFLLIWWMLVE